MGLKNQIFAYMKRLSSLLVGAQVYSYHSILLQTVTWDPFCLLSVAGTWRVGGVLAVSRAFGDRLLKKYVVAEPEIQVEHIVSCLLSYSSNPFFYPSSNGYWE